MKEITRIPLEGLHNTRDLGGFETADGRKIRPRRLIRSGQLSGMTEKDKQVLTEDYGLRTDVDFRTGQERTEAPDPRLPGVAYVENPILSDQAIGITREKDSEEDMMKLLVQQMSTSEKAAEEYMAGLYRNLVMDPFSRQQYRKFFGILLDQKEGAVLWHCSAGKDRVGVGTALLLSALGIPRETILADYMMVNTFTAEVVESRLEELNERLQNPQLIDCLRELMQVRESYLISVFQAIEDGYGTMESFLEKEMGLCAEKREQLREMYLEG